MGLQRQREVVLFHNLRMDLLDLLDNLNLSHCFCVASVQNHTKKKETYKGSKKAT